MAEPDNIVLNHLRGIRAALDDMHHQTSELVIRAGHLETGQARIETQLADHSVRMDRVNARLERIERRLDLVETE